MGRKRKRDLEMEMKMMCVEENGEPVIYIEADGVRIAKRGHPDSAQARTWVSLEPGWSVRDIGPVKNGKLAIEYNPVAVQ